MKKDCGSIFEFAAKFGGINHDQVARALNLERRLEDKPNLKNLFANGEVSASKILRVVSIATSQNEAALAAQVKLLPQKALEVLVREEKAAISKDQNGLFEAKFDEKSVRTHEFNFSSKLNQKLQELQQKGFDLNELLLELLEKRKKEIEQTKAEVEIPAKSSRYIPAKIKKIIKAEHVTKCSIQTCQKPSTQIHHTQRYSIAHTHDPHYLAPLCNAHHQIAHAVDIKIQEVKFSMRLQRLRI